MKGRLVSNWGAEAEAAIRLGIQTAGEFLVCLALTGVTPGERGRAEIMRVYLEYARQTEPITINRSKEGKTHGRT